MASRIKIWCVIALAGLAGAASAQSEQPRQRQRDQLREVEPPRDGVRRERGGREFFEQSDMDDLDAQGDQPQVPPESGDRFRDRKRDGSGSTAQRVPGNLQGGPGADGLNPPPLDRAGPLGRPGIRQGPRAMERPLRSERGNMAGPRRGPDDRPNARAGAGPAPRGAWRQSPDQPGPGMRPGARPGIGPRAQGPGPNADAEALLAWRSLPPEVRQRIVAHLTQRLESGRPGPGARPSAPQAPRSRAQSPERNTPPRLDPPVGQKIRERADELRGRAQRAPSPAGPQERGARRPRAGGRV